MELQSVESAYHGYAADRVPETAQGSGWRVFFIVAGSLCGLPVFILSAAIFTSLGFEHGLGAILLGSFISGLLGACSAFTGSSSRMGLALLADQAFGPWGARLVKVVIAIALVGWFGVGIGVLGSAAAAGLGQITGWQVPALAITVPVCLGIAAVTIFGATGLQRMGTIVVPATAALLILSVVLVWPETAKVWIAERSANLSFGDAVSAIVGSYMVGIVIQPDYGRFVRSPSSAAIGAASALAVVYPLIMTLSSLASLTTGSPHLISAMILLGFGIPALVVLLLGTWIDSAAALYSASLSLANQFPRIGFRSIVVIITLIGMSLVFVGVEAAFIPFLMGLGLALPPLATILILSYFLDHLVPRVGVSRLPPALCWAFGTAVGVATTNGLLVLSTLPALDSIVATGLLFALIRLALPGTSEARQAH